MSVKVLSHPGHGIQVLQLALGYFMYHTHFAVWPISEFYIILLYYIDALMYMLCTTLYTLLIIFCNNIKL